MFGAGSAGIGISNILCSTMQTDGLSKEDAINRISMFDVNGLIESARNDLSDSQKIYAHKYTPTKDLVKAIQEIKPTILIGVSTVGKAFTQDVSEAMCTLNELLLIFALSILTSHLYCLIY